MHKSTCAEDLVLYPFIKFLLLQVTCPTSNITIRSLGNNKKQYKVNKNI